MRRMFASVFVVVAALAALVTLPLAWVGHNVADEDGYVAFTSPMGSDPELQKPFSAYLSDYFVREGRLPSALQPTVATVLATAAATTANAPGFTEAWEESQRRSHRLMFGPNAKQDRLAVDLGPLATFAVDHAAGDLPVALPKPGPIVLQVNTSSQREAIDQLDPGVNAYLARTPVVPVVDFDPPEAGSVAGPALGPLAGTCLLYTSDAADDLPCVDLGGRRPIQHKTHHASQTYPYVTLIL